VDAFLLKRRYQVTKPLPKDTSHRDTSPDAVQRACWRYLWEKGDPHNGLVPDHLDSEGLIVSPASIAATGMALSALPTGVQNGWVTRHDAAQRARQTLRFFAREAQHHHGFFFHFLDMSTGERVWECEVSSVDSTLLFLGALFCRAYFNGKTAVETEVRELATDIFERADWNWFCNGQDGVSLAYTPERGFSSHIWRGFNEGLLVYILALGSKSHALPVSSYEAWTRDYETKRIYGIDFLYSRPLFTHLFPHLWLDLRTMRDDFMRREHLNYFENARRAVAVQEEWARRRGDARMWGVSACDGPNRRKNGGYHARGVPFGRFDGVYSPPVCLASLPFEPETASTAWQFWIEKHPELLSDWGVAGAVEPSTGWISGTYGLDAAMLVLMLENVRSGLFWELSHTISELQTGLERAGFR
jgi:hypothetical protein